MAPASNEEQFKFLISCIRYSNNGKVDFGQVATECKIVSKGAAAKRYERMMRAHGIGNSAKPSSSRMKVDPSIVAGAKRKLAQFEGENGGDMVDDEESFKRDASAVKREGVKEERDVKDIGRIKKEEGPLELGEAVDLMRYYDLAEDDGSPDFEILGDGFGALDQKDKRYTEQAMN